MTGEGRVRTGFIVAVCVLIPFAAHAIWDQVEATRLSNAIRAIQNRGEPVNLSAARRPLDSDEQRQASRMYFAAALLAFTKEPTGATRPALQVLDLATPLDFRRFSSDRPTYSYLASDLSQLSRVNALRTEDLAMRGDAPGAAASHLASVRLLRAFTGSSRWFASSPVNELVVLLSRTQPDEAALRALQYAYEQQATNDGVLDALLEQRAAQLEFCWPYTVGRSSWVQRLRSGPLARDVDPIGFIVLRPWLTHRVINMLERFDEEIALARQPWPQRFESMKALHRLDPGPRQPLSPVPIGTAMLGVPMPPVIAGPGAIRVGENLALNRSAVVVLGVERFRRQHNGAAPPTVDALVPQYLTSLPTDPFSGKPLRFTQDATAYTIYSVGMNQRDDGGALQEGDVGIRIPFNGNR
jgi:hypothetical protein